MRIAFAGTPEFARAALAALHAAGHTVALVLTQPDRPAGRGMKLAASPVKDFALAHGLAMAQPRGLRLDGALPTTPWRRATPCGRRGRKPSSSPPTA
jgi:methionyl-tRNA formyltransferase